MDIQIEMIHLNKMIPMWLHLLYLKQQFLHLSLLRLLNIALILMVCPRKRVELRMIMSLESTSYDNINSPRRPHLISQLAGLPSHDTVETDDELGVDEFLANIRALEQTDSNGNEDKQTSSPVESRSCLSKSDLSSECSSSCVPPSGSSLSSFNSEESRTTLVVRKSSRIRKTKVIFDNSEENPIKRRKTVLSQTLENLLQVPSLSEKRRETKRKRREITETNDDA